MRLIKLELLNLASLDRKEGEVILFEEGALKESTIFSIVGPTGSGKSTILDAICLALYNRAPRYPRKKGDRNQNIEIYGELTEGEKYRLAPTDCRNILTRGKKEGYSKLTFLANDGCLYRAEWYVKFQRVKYDQVITSLYKLGTANGKPVEMMADWNELPQIIGLDYEQFLRTVLIAQGSFANFLTAKENERYELLEKLVGCEDLYTRIAGLIKEEKDRAVRAYDRIHADLAAYEKDLISEPELTVLKEEITQLETADKALKAQLVAINEAITWYGNEENFQKKLACFLQKQQMAIQALEAAQEEIEKLHLHDSTLPALGSYKDILTTEEQIGQLKTELTQLTQAISSQETKIQEEEEKQITLQATENKATQALEEQRPHINRARILLGELEGSRRSVAEKNHVQTECEVAHKKAELELTANQTAIEGARKQVELTKTAFENLQKTIASHLQQQEEKVKQNLEAYQTELQKIQHIDVAQLQQAKNDADQLFIDLKEALRILTEQRNKRETFLKNRKEIDELTLRKEKLESALGQLSLEALNAEVETLQKSLTLITSENWNLHRQELMAGQPCPLCGATEHPYTNQEKFEPILHELQNLVAAKKITLAEQTRKQQVLTKEWGENEGKLQSLYQNQQVLKEEGSVLQQAWKQLKEVHTTWKEETEGLQELLLIASEKVKTSTEALTQHHTIQATVNQLRETKEESEKVLKLFTEKAEMKLREAEQKQREAETLLQTEQGKTAQLQSALAEKKMAMNQAIVEWQKAQERLAQQKATLLLEIGNESPDSLEQQLTKAQTDARDAVKLHQETLGQLRENLRGMHGKKEATQAVLTPKLALLQHYQNDLTKWLEDFNATYEQKALSINDITQLYEATDSWEEIRQRQTTLQTALTTAQTTLANEEKAHTKHQEQKPIDSLEELEKLKKELENQTNDALTDAKARLQRHLAAKQEMGMLYETCQQAHLQKAEWEEIYDAIGGEGKTLRKIAQCYTLRFLIAHANEEIRKFNQRYELLQVENSLGIRVIDHDRADDVRDTTSLSGGETFIVSLGLALGLSALSSRNISFENLFIDEGFGTLDPETLATVIDSLAMLQSSQGKKVGVISHTDTMSERITTQIRIIKNGNSGSSHIEIYP